MALPVHWHLSQEAHVNRQRCKQPELQLCVALQRMTYHVIEQILSWENVRSKRESARADAMK